VLGDARIVIVFSPIGMTDEKEPLINVKKRFFQYKNAAECGNLTEIEIEKWIKKKNQPST